MDTRITGVRPAESPPGAVPPSSQPARPSELAREQVARPDPLAEGHLIALTLALLACVGAALAAGFHHVAWWPAFLVLAFFILLELSEARARR